MSINRSLQPVASGLLTRTSSVCRTRLCSAVRSLKAKLQLSQWRGQEEGGGGKGGPRPLTLRRVTYFRVNMLFVGVLDAGLL